MPGTPRREFGRQREYHGNMKSGTWNLELGMPILVMHSKFLIPLIPNSCGVLVFDVPSDRAFERPFDAAGHKSQLPLRLRRIDEHLVPRHPDAFQRDRRLAT